MSVTSRRTIFCNRMSRAVSNCVRYNYYSLNRSLNILSIVFFLFFFFWFVHISVDSDFDRIKVPNYSVLI